MLAPDGPAALFVGVFHNVVDHGDAGASVGDPPGEEREEGGDVGV